MKKRALDPYILIIKESEGGVGGGCSFDIIVGAYSAKAAHKSMGTYSRNTICYFKYT